MGRLLGIAGAVVCAGAGVYLLQYNATDPTTGGTSWFQIISHGMGIYFIGKGMFLAYAAWSEGEQAGRLSTLVTFAAQAHERATAQPRTDGLVYLTVCQSCRHDNAASATVCEQCGTPLELRPATS